MSKICFEFSSGVVSQYYLELGEEAGSMEFVIFGKFPLKNGF
jgi:hypothetical protein